MDGRTALIRAGYETNDDGDGRCRRPHLRDLDGEGGEAVSGSPLLALSLPQPATNATRDRGMNPSVAVRGRDGGWDDRFGDFKEQVRP